MVWQFSIKIDLEGIHNPQTFVVFIVLLHLFSRLHITSQPGRSGWVMSSIRWLCWMDELLYVTLPWGTWRNSFTFQTWEKMKIKNNSSINQIISVNIGMFGSCKKHFGRIRKKIMFRFFKNLFFFHHKHSWSVSKLCSGFTLTNVETLSRTVVSCLKAFRPALHHCRLHPPT